VAAPIIWKEITTAFKAGVTGGSYAVEERNVRVRTSLGEKATQLEGPHKRTFLDLENRKWLRETQSDALGRAQTFVH
jgi:hypothetical protein